MPNLNIHPFLHFSSIIFSAILLFSELARSEVSPTSAATNYCSNYNVANPGNETRIQLSEDRRTICFDGVIKPDLDAATFERLADDGFFVVRSWGGYTEPAMAISDILLQRRAKVVIRDYCLSACANHFLIASYETYVMENAIIAWHGGHPRVSCDDVERAGLMSTTTESRKRVDFWKANCHKTQAVNDFFSKRGIDGRFIYQPQTQYTKKIFDAALRGSGNRQTIFWMWNPQNHQSYFKSKIVYERYPQSQDEVDEIIGQHRLGIRVFYDPAQ